MRVSITSANNLLVANQSSHRLPPSRWLKNVPVLRLVSTRATYVSCFPLSDVLQMVDGFSMDEWTDGMELPMSSRIELSETSRKRSVLRTVRFGLCGKYDRIELKKLEIAGDEENETKFYARVRQSGRAIREIIASRMLSEVTVFASAYAYVAYSVRLYLLGLFDSTRKLRTIQLPSIQQSILLILSNCGIPGPLN